MTKCRRCGLPIDRAGAHAEADGCIDALTFDRSVLLLALTMYDTQVMASLAGAHVARAHAVMSIQTGRAVPPSEPPARDEDTRDAARPAPVHPAEALR